MATSFHAPNLYVPYINCGWKVPEDGTCVHPSNATPECHQHCCPIKAATCPHTNTIDQGPDGVLCTDCGETV